MNIIETLAKEFNIKVEQVEKTVALIDEGNTIPFIARYRKEVTGSLDDTVLRALDDRLNYLRNIEKRKQEVKDLIAAQDKLTPEIEAAINAAKTITRESLIEMNGKIYQIQSLNADHQENKIIIRATEMTTQVNIIPKPEPEPSISDI
jgi:DNA repair exonuclease SbcCD ATPase subunit